MTSTVHSAIVTTARIWSVLESVSSLGLEYHISTHSYCAPIVRMKHMSDSLPPLCVCVSVCTRLYNLYCYELKMECAVGRHRRVHTKTFPHQCNHTTQALICYGRRGPKRELNALVYPSNPSLTVSCFCCCCSGVFCVLPCPSEIIMMTMTSIIHSPSSLAV